VKIDWEALLEAADCQTATQELGHPPMREERNLEDAVGKSELRGVGAEAILDRRRPVREGNKPDIQARSISRCMAASSVNDPLRSPSLP
jgi:hypothetical protein